MILSGHEITRLVHRTAVSRDSGYPPMLPSISIEPFDEQFAGPNSYDVHLSPQLKVYALDGITIYHPCLREEIHRIEQETGRIYSGVDVNNPPPCVEFPIPSEGCWLFPGILYLGATVERTHCEGLVPWLDGRSSIGRLGLSLHVTAGRGDDGWPGRWTLEITAVTHPVKVYSGMRCGQLTFFGLHGERKPYTGRYRDQDGPTESRLHQDH